MVSLGLADGVLTAKPVITYWRHVIKRYTNFALEAHDLDFNQGVAAFGSSPSCNLDRIGDLVYWMYVTIQLPGIGLSYIDPQTQLPAIVPPSLKVNNVAVEPYWTHAVGQAMIERTSFFIGGQSIDEIYGELMYIWEELSGAPGKRLQEMTGKYDSIYALQTVSRQPRNLYVPLYFWFTLNSGLALPLVSLQFHSVKVSVLFRGLNELLKLTCAALGAPYSYTLSSIQQRAQFNGQYYEGAAQPVSDLSPLTSTSLGAQISVTYVYLDQNERAKFAEGAFESVIPQHQHQYTTQTQTVSTQYATGNVQRVTIDLNFNHTVMELFWVIRMGVCEGYQQGINPCTNLYNEWFNFGGPPDFVTYLAIDPCLTAQLLLNNANRWDQQEGRYFRLVQPYQHHTNIPDKFIYCYSFALQPQDIQPSGTCNFSRIDSTRLLLTVDGRCFYGPSTVGGNDGNSSVTILVYARNWNVLRFKYGYQLCALILWMQRATQAVEWVLKSLLVCCAACNTSKFRERPYSQCYQAIVATQ